MGRKYDFKYLVIGGGAAGTAAAQTLAKAKKRVGLVEGGYFGGANLNTRDVPYAVTLDFAHTFYRALHLPEFGYEDFSFSFPSVVAHQMKAVVELGGNNPARYEQSGLIVIQGYANFLDEHTVAVGERKFTAENFILATGTKLKTDGIDGLNAVNYLPPETALKIRRLPEAALIVGGGSTGCEIAEYYATLGAKTIIVEKSPRLLPQEDVEASQAVASHLANDLGVMVLTNSRVLALAQDDASKYIVFESEHEQKMVRADCIILATGSKANLDYGLNNTGVKITKDGVIKTDRYFATSVKHIYAVGDCIGGDSSTERAAYEGRMLASNLASKSKSVANYLGFARITNTLPAVVSFGLSETELKRKKIHFKKAIAEINELPASKIYNTREGFVKLIVDHSGHLIGATIVANNASEMAGEIALAIRHRLTALELASAPHPVNQFSYGIQLAARKLVKK